jgi:hypothetical protein
MNHRNASRLPEGRAFRAIRRTMTGFCCCAALLVPAASYGWLRPAEQSDGPAARPVPPAGRDLVPSPAHAAVGTMYYAESMTQRICRADLDGTRSETVLGGLDAPNAVAIIGDRIYWTESPTRCIRSAQLDGSDVRRVAELPVGAVSLAGDPTHNRLYVGLVDGMVLAVSLDRSKPEVRQLDPGPPPSDGSRPVFRTARGLDYNPGGKLLYFIEKQMSEGSLYQTDPDGERRPEVLVTHLKTPSDLCFCPASGRIYWVQNCGNDPPARGIYSAKADGGDVRQVVAMPDRTPLYLAIDSVGGRLYCSVFRSRPARPTSPEVYCCDLDGKHPASILTGVRAPRIVFDYAHGRPPLGLGRGTSGEQAGASGASASRPATGEE